MGHQNLRKGRISIQGQLYLITVVCKDREKRFSDFFIAAETSRVMAQQPTWSDATVLAWVLMPDHYHASIQLGENTCLQKVMKRANSVLAIQVNRAANRHGQVWLSAFYDRAIRREENVRSAARYLIANPIRAKIVNDIGNYPFWDAIWLSHKPEDIVL